LQAARRPLQFLLRCRPGEAEESQGATLEASAIYATEAEPVATSVTTKAWGNQDT
jgi:hypothetical protein